VILAQGALGLAEELVWFDEQATVRGLALDAAPLPATTGYAELLDRLDASDPASALTALSVLERVYLDAWSSAAPGAEAYRGCVAHWTTPAFASYVGDLERAADALLGPGAVPPGLDALVADVLTAETAFWDMALAVP
jgi:thiaminase/transcriptional activator TenA